jgi:hypothetical protein
VMPTLNPDPWEADWVHGRRPKAKLSPEEICSKLITTATKRNLLVKKFLVRIIGADIA